MQYLVQLIRDEEGISVSVPALPGCASQGDTEEEAMENIRDAIQEYLGSVKETSGGAEIRFVEVG